MWFRVISRYALTVVVIIVGFHQFAPGVQFHAPHGLKWVGFLALYAAAFAGLAHAIDLFFRYALQRARHFVHASLVLGFTSGGAVLLHVLAQQFPQHLTVLGWRSAFTGGFLLMGAHMMSLSADAVPQKLL